MRASRRRRRVLCSRVLLLWALFIPGLACLPAGRGVPLDEEGLVVVAVLDPIDSERVLSAQVGTTRQGLASSVPAGGRALVFTAPFERLYAPDGELASEDQLAQLTARLGEDAPPGGSCGRCLDSGGEAQILFAGQACPPAWFSTVQQFDAGILSGVTVSEEVRAQIRVDVPGPCQSLPPEIAPGPDPVLEPVFPFEDFEQFERIAVDQAGVVAVFNATSGIAIAPDGTRTALSGFDGLASFRDAEGLEEGFLIATDRPGGAGFNAEVQLTRVVPGRPAETVRGAEATGVNFLRRIPTEQWAALGRPDAKDLVLIGGDGRAGGFVAICDLDGSRLDCDEVTPPRFIDEAVSANSADFFADGELLVGGVDFAVTGRREGDEWVWGPAVEPVLPGQIPEAQRSEGATRVDQVIVRGEEAYACTRRNSWIAWSHGRRVVISGEKPRIDWTLVSAEDRDFGGCLGFVERADRPGKVYGLGQRDTVIELTWNEVRPSAIHRALTEIIPGLTEAVGDAPQVFGDRTWVLTARSDVYVERASTGLDRIYGQDRAVVTHDQAIRLADGQLRLLSARGAVRRVDLDGGTTSLGSLMPALGEGERLTAVAPDPEEALGFIAVGFDLASQTTWMRRYIDERQTSEIRIERGDLGLIPGRITIARGDRIFVSGEDWAVWQIIGDEARWIPIEWDDPRTPGPDDRPEEILPPDHSASANSHRCTYSRHRFDPFVPISTHHGWCDAEEADGVLWLVGSVGTVGRLIVGSGRPIERMLVSFHRDSISGITEIDPPPALTAVRAIGPTGLLVGTPGFDKDAEIQGRFWTISGAGETGHPRSEIMVDHHVPGDPVFRPSGAPELLIGDPERGYSIGFSEGRYMGLAGRELIRMSTALRGFRKEPGVGAWVLQSPDRVLLLPQ